VTDREGPGAAPSDSDGSTTNAPPQPPVEPVVAGPLGEVSSRASAFIIDLILVTVVTAILLVGLGLLLGPASTSGVVYYGAVGVDVGVALVVTFAYFYFMWVATQATLGMRVVGIRVSGDGSDESVMPKQAAVRWAVLAAPAAFPISLTPVPGLGIVVLVALAIWYTALLVTTAMSPTKQGLHDRAAHTIIVKVTRRIA
jgi:uncharacterized RDD family membrane protein YckC